MPPLLVLAGELYAFSIGYYSKSKEYLKIVKWKWSRSVMSDSLWPLHTRLLCLWDFSGKNTRAVIAYGEWCQIHGLWSRFSFRTRDQAWSLKSFCVAEFYKSEKGTEKASDIDIRKGMKSAPLASLSKGAIYFLSSHYNKSKDCFKAVKILLDPLPQFIF